METNEKKKQSAAAVDAYHDRDDKKSKNIKTDTEGSYTGTADDGKLPMQDADDI